MPRTNSEDQSAEGLTYNQNEYFVVSSSNFAFEDNDQPIPGLDELSFLRSYRSIKKNRREQTLGHCVKCGTDLDELRKLSEKNKEKFRAHKYGRTGNNLYCPSCAQKHLQECPMCRYSFDKVEDEWERGEYRGEEISVCAKCAFNSIGNCCLCDKVIMKNGARIIGARNLGGTNINYICYSCEKKFTNHCERCGDTYPTESFTIYQGNRICPACLRDITPGIGTGLLERRVGNVRIPPIMVPGRIIEDAHTVGTEIEVEGYAESGITEHDFPQEIGFTHDGSLEDGIEVLTPPRCAKEFENVIEATCAKLSSRGLHPSIRCGLHVHFGLTTAERSPASLIKIFETYYWLEDVLFSMLPYSRRKNRYCKPLKSGFVPSDFIGKRNIEWIIYKTKENTVIDGRKRNKYDGSRYYFVNLHSVFFRKTLEIRSHSGTLNPDKILYWTYINQCILNYAVNHFDSSKRPVLKKISETTDPLVAAQMFCDLLNIKPEVKQYMFGRINLFRGEE